MPELRHKQSASMLVRHLRKLFTGWPQPSNLAFLPVKLGNGQEVDLPTLDEYLFGGFVGAKKTLSSA
jgi:hypothetical protein